MSDVFQLEIMILTPWRNVYFRSFMRMFVKTSNVFKKTGSYGKLSLYVYYSLVSMLLFQVFVVSISMLVLFLFLRYVEGSDTIATR